MRRIIFYGLLTIISMNAFGEQTKQKVDYQVINSGKFSAKSVSGVRSMKDGVHYTALAADRGSIIRYRYCDGQVVDTLLNIKRASAIAKISSYTLSDDENLVILPLAREQIYRHSFVAEHWIYDRVEHKYYPLSKNGKQQAATISPNSRYAAFVRNNNLFVVDLSSGIEKALTADGIKGEVINGVADWVYEEEYGFERAYEWSPSSDAIAYYRFDESKVKSYSMPTYRGALYPKDESFKYPKAGEDNSSVQIRICSVESGQQALVNVGKQLDQYIPLIEWTGRDNELAVHRLNRKQNEYHLLLADANTGITRAIYSEQSDRYIDRIDASKIYFMPLTSTFIVKNENSGFMHLYLYDMTGKLLRQLTSGDQEITQLNALDTQNKTLYYTATDGALNTALYSINYAKKKLSKPLRLSDETKGNYSAIFGAGAKYYIEYFSNTETPTQVKVHDTKQGQIRTLVDNAALSDTVALYDLPVKEFFSFTNHTGEVLNGYILKPSDFDPSKKYPLFITQYSGPGSQSVANKWGVGWEAALVGDGYLVACVDGRGTGFRGKEFRSSTYGQLGKYELEDQVATAQYLGSLSFIDASRIGIYGWSFGGFMAMNAILKAGDVFKLAVAVAPVTSWRYYDTIYTELYNGLPAENASGYDDNSPLNFAEGLKGKLLIAHGTADDNVHIQNTYDMISALRARDKQFDMLIYPDQNHGMGSGRNHLMLSIIGFVNANL